MISTSFVPWRKIKTGAAASIFLGLLLISFYALIQENSSRLQESMARASRKVKPKSSSEGKVQVEEHSKTTRQTLAPISICKLNISTLTGNLLFDPRFISAEHLSVTNGGFVKDGGSWSPKDCISPSRVAILIPYRNRPEQLEIFLGHMHPILKRQKLNYRIFVVEQAGKEIQFNKGAIYNIGFDKTASYGDYDCYIFHDIDLLTENDHNYYGCPSSPMHMSPAIDKYKYKLPYHYLIGGIQALTKQHYTSVNGYSNKFWGWGGEDDNLYLRVTNKGLKWIRPDMNVGRYKMNMNKHFRKDGWNFDNIKLVTELRDKQDVDGLNSIRSLNYSLTEELRPLYTLLSIDLRK